MRYEDLLVSRVCRILTFGAHDRSRGRWRDRRDHHVSPTKAESADG